METRLIYRVENDAGVGAFEGISWDDYDKMIARHPRLQSASDFPTPSYDPGLERRIARRLIDFDGYCGCRSLHQLRRWFPQRVLSILEDNGMQLTLWEVPRNLVAYGWKQVLFARDAATCLDNRPVAELYA
jgi:hypothetical protein